MGIGVGIFLIAVGAVLTFAVHVSTTGIDLHTVGIILMAAGGIRRRPVTHLLVVVGRPDAWRRDGTPWSTPARRLRRQPRTRSSSI